MKGYVLTVEKTVPAPPEVVFDILTDVSRHHLIDGSGMLRGAKVATPQRLVLGSTFGMGMKMLVNYSTLNRVVEFEDNRRIAWKTGPTGFMGKLMGGRVWRYELAPVDGGTLVTESWDITPDPQRVLLKLGDIWSGKTRRDMERTLERLSVLVAGQGASDSPDRT
ncbi:MAG TPA: SRPBCC family protein [Acidimicrobiales bacterium]